MRHEHSFGPRGTAQCLCGMIPGASREENLRAALLMAIRLAEEGWGLAPFPTAAGYITFNAHARLVALRSVLEKR